MNKLLILFFLIISSCDTGKLNIITDLPKTLNEVSGTETTQQTNLIWMLNDSGNKARIYGINKKGNIEKELKINAKNHDWEDLASDHVGNIYIGDFGNNQNKRTNLTILKVNAEDLEKDSKIDIERISFKYPKQDKFPPKKKQMFFDCESFFYYKNSLYLFTKSRVRGDFGKTDLYKIPATPGHHVAEYINSFNSCDDSGCWITSADISDDGKQVVLLSPKAAIVFSNFTSDDFFTGEVKRYDFTFDSQKEGVCFTDNNTLLITDEKAHGAGGNLYSFSLN
ncbi:hypothetical protein [Algibacter amylolyticus]|uniref:hypothetical protein n=1 Tax=Algibacter amylolyticus TaxID=1608400 RepID=UPI0017E4DCED|nr:hypothetical protein [Algibacter amylolyticus]MBB5267275.1 hypothetical protein [Algibacter amylolyticus]